jgi:DNA mismatch repair protein MutS
MSKQIDTPMMRHFFEMKNQNPDAILLYRCGDFYETYCDDALTASQVLGITLTMRGKGTDNAIHMAGFPFHALDNYLPKLVRAGYRVAICDQLEDPKLCKTKLVKRGITELVTPGVSYNDNLLDYKQNTFLAAVHFNKASVGVSFLDISTGEFLAGQGTAEYVSKLLSSFAPKEILFERGKNDSFYKLYDGKTATFTMEDWVFSQETAQKRLLKQFEVSTLKGFGINDLNEAIVAAGAVLYYLDQTQHFQTSHITQISRIHSDNFVWLDKFTIRNLELFSTGYGDGKALVDVLDDTRTAMGARLLRRYVAFPLKSIDAINSRLNIVDSFFREPEIKDTLLSQLSDVGDLERLVSKIAVLRVNPREVVQLKVALTAIEQIQQLLRSSSSEDFNALAEKLSPLTEIRDKIHSWIEIDPPIAVNRGKVIREGVDAELDEYRSLAFSGKDYLLKMQQREIENTGISSLKIGYNNVFGYYIEVRNMHKDSVPEEWIRKQTLANAERYITPELKEYEDKILGAEEKILSIETRLYMSLVEELCKYIAPLQKNAEVLSQLDVLSNFASISARYGYNRPVVEDSDVLEVKEGRHPVIERQLPIGEQYIANDLYLDTQSQQIIIITGPNMAGKSALLRQTALIVLMAQIGCYVPASAAKVGVVDKIFTRVGAGDNISMGESTFMVEMNEAASILNNMTNRSLVLFDELGRGTSTYDGISIAWSIVEYIHEHPSASARTLFATHYHELNEMKNSFSRIRNFNVSVQEVGGKVIFLRKLVPGGSEHSFGIHVAKLAGMPKSVVARANQVLEDLEGENSDKRKSIATKKLDTLAEGRTGYQLSLFQLDDPVLSQVRDEILKVDINSLTPIDALNKLNEIKKIITGKSK